MGPSNKVDRVSVLRQLLFSENIFQATVSLIRGLKYSIPFQSSGELRVSLADHARLSIPILVESWGVGFLI
jgi:hypothetical protein